jgi:hypothetical protein
MLPFPMIVASPTQISFPLLRARRLHRPSRGIGVHPERLGAFSSLLSSSNISTFKPSNPQTVPSPSSFPATLTTRVKHKSLACHSYKKHPGWGLPSFFKSTPRSNHAFTSNSHGITSFAHPPPLNSSRITSLQKHGGRVPGRVPGSTLDRTFCALSHIAQPSHALHARKVSRGGAYSARSIDAGSIRTACITGRSAAKNAPARIASDGSASICKSVALT